MLLLNISGRYAKPKGNGVSIHLMLLLNIERQINEIGGIQFQYILCCY